MNIWNQNQNQNNMMMGQAQFTPYNPMPIYNPRLPIYKADPINGESAAWQFPIGGGEIYLPDANEDIIWWIRVDQNGNKTVTPFNITPCKKEDPVDINDLLARLTAVEEWINAKSNKSNAKRSTNAATVPAGSVD